MWLWWCPRLESVWVRALPGYQYVVKDVTLHAKMGDILLVCGSEGAGTQGQ